MRETLFPRQDEEKSIREPLLGEQAIIRLKEYSGHSERVLGFLLLHQVAEELKDFLPIKVPEIVIIGPEVLNEIFQYNRLLEPTQRTISDRINSLQRLDSLYPNFSVRHGIVVPGEPRARLDSWNNLSDPKEALEAVRKMADSFIKQGFHRISGSEFSLFVQQYADPPNLQGDAPPAGGEAFLRNVDVDGTAFVEVHALYGDNAAVQMGVVADRFVVTFDQQRGVTNIESEIQHKLSTLLLAKDEPLKYSKVSLPLEIQDKPAINQHELLRVVYTVVLASQKAGKPIRVEFFRGPYFTDPLKPSYGPVISEAIPYSPPLSEQRQESFRRSVLSVISKPEEIKCLLKKHKEGKLPGNSLVVLRRDVLVGEQLTNLFAQLRAFPVPLTLLTPGLRETEHRARQITDGTSHEVIPIGTQQIHTGDVIRIEAANGRYEIVNETRLGKLSILIALQEAVALGFTQPELIGGKAANLAFLIERGHHLPFSFVLSKEFSTELLKKNGLFETWQSLKDISSKEELATKFAQIRKGLKELPSSWHDVREILKANLPSAPTTRLAVRSNISIEDVGILGETTGFFSLAGIFESFLDIPFDRNFGDITLDCCRSAFSERAAAVLLPNSQKETVERTQRILASYFPAVLIQEMINANISGTGFYGEVLGVRRPHIIIIEAQPGIAGVVGGEGEDERPLLTLKFNTQTQAFESITLKVDNEKFSLLPQHLDRPPSRISLQLPSLNLALARLLVNKVKKVSNDLGAPADIEWAVGQRSSRPDGPTELFLLQARSLR